MKEESKNYKEVKKILRQRLVNSVVVSFKSWAIAVVVIPVFAFLTGFVAKACVYAFMFAFNTF